LRRMPEKHHAKERPLRGHDEIRGAARGPVILATAERLGCSTSPGSDQFEMNNDHTTARSFVRQAAVFRLAREGHQGDEISARQDSASSEATKVVGQRAGPPLAGHVEPASAYLAAGAGLSRRTKKISPLGSSSWPGRRRAFTQPRLPHRAAKRSRHSPGHGRSA